MDKEKLEILNIIRIAIKEENPNTDNYELPNPINKRLRTLASMASDLTFVVNAMNELIKITKHSLENNVVKTALWQSSVIIYCKCFSDSSKNGHSKLESKDCFKLENDLLAIHVDVFRVRNNFIAHRGENEYEQSIAFFTQPKKDSIEQIASQFKVKSLRANNLSIDNLENYLKLFVFIENHVQEKINIQCKKIYKMLKEKYSQEEILKFLIV